MSRITVHSIILGQRNSLNPFNTLRNVLHDELFPQFSAQVRIALYAMLGVLSATFFVSVFCIVVRVRRGDGWPYKFSRMTDGRLLLPNSILHWLVWHCFYVLLLFPLVFLGNLRTGGTLCSAPIWRALVYVPEFLKVWNVAWGTTASALLQRDRLASPTSRIRLPPLFVSAFLILGMIGGPVALVTVDGIYTARWNSGIAAFRELDARLVRQGGTFMGDAESGKKRDADLVLDAIPMANKLLDRMSAAFRDFHSPYWICASLSILGAVILAVAAIIQMRALHRQMSWLQVPSTINPSEEEKRSASPWRPTHRRNNSRTPILPSTTSSSTTSDTSRLTTTYRNVLLVLAAISISALAYSTLCLVGDLAMTHSPIFNMSTSTRLHLYLFLFAFAPLDVLVVATIAWHTFDPKTHPVTHDSRRNSGSSGGKAAPMISPPVLQDVVSIQEPSMSVVEGGRFHV